MVYARVLVNGSPETFFLSLEPLEHAHADGIYQAIDQAFRTNGILNWKDKLVGVGCDGASVNIGRNNSVATRIQDQGHDYILIVHCVAHRLELGVLSAIRDNRLMADLKDVLHKIYKHYHYSPKAVREVQEIAESMDENILRPNRVDGTRWTPHMERALRILTTSYNVLLAHFEHVSQARTATAEVTGRAVFLTRKLRDFKFVKFMHFMRDLLGIIATLSQRFQRDDLTASSMLDALEAANLEFVNLSLGPGMHLQAFLDNLQDVPGNPAIKLFKGVELTNPAQRRQQQVAQGEANEGQADAQPEPDHYQELVQSVQDHINGRLENAGDNSTAILRACRVFDVAEWPGDRVGLAGYGNAQITTLINHFNPLLARQGDVVDLEVIRQEWTDLKAYMHNLGAGNNVDGPQPNIGTCFRNGMEPRFHNILKIYEVAMVLPISSAICERGFSCLKRIKSDWRSGLTTEQMCRLMAVSIQGPSFDDYVAERALHRWWEGGQRARRPQFAQPGDDDVDELLDMFVNANQ